MIQFFSPSAFRLAILSWRQICRYLMVSLAFTILFSSNIPVDAAVVTTNSGNLDSVLNGAEIVFVNFYADWCRFSQMLTPVFEEASNKFQNQPAGKVTFASVDCDREVDVAQKYHINKYPTLKLFRGGEPSKKEYRGQRSAEALSEFVQQQLTETTQDFSSDQDLEARLEKNKRNIIGYFTAKEGPEYENVVAVSKTLRDECGFWFGIGDNFKQQTMGGNNIAFRPPRTQNEDQLFTGNLGDPEYVKQWITDKCIPLVREITFENAEELTEEGLPFLILFRKVEDTAIVETFATEVAGQLGDQKTAINFLTADGKKFAHPLHHLGKAESDLPLIAIDSFRHMYLFPDMSKLTVPGELRKFVMDLHSGKLHREFHHGPDPNSPSQDQISQGSEPVVPSHGSQGAQPPGEQQGVGKTTPPVSVFEKLKPSRNRYTLIANKDEL